ncbi:hypothetical protein C0993_012381 [Termitomyces sp. T159_Od127]|nr:hypothetical protein C0993_012381 [Termitomyces sp. T159_Od127]
MEPGPYIRDSTSANHTVMPTEIDLDAAEPLASGNTAPVKGDEQDSSLSSILTDVEEHIDKHNTSYISDNNTSYNTPTHRARNPYVEDAPDKAENAFTEAHSQLTEVEREHIERRMEKVLSFQTKRKAEATKKIKGGENPLVKGKTIDP